MPDCAAAAFIARWQGVSASELSTAQSFVRELCDLLGVAKPHPTPEQDYMFERPITFAHGDGSTSAGRIDCYKRGHFVLEAKKLKAPGHTRSYDDGLQRARSQAQAYARALPAAEGRPPFVLVVDVGNVIELYAEFSRSGATYTPFPDPRSHRIALTELARPELRQRLALIWTEPDRLNPALISAQVTRGVADVLARLAKLFESAGCPADQVAAYLTRCLFCMFAEDVGLLPENSFTQLLQRHRDQPDTLRHMLSALWADMDHGGFSAALAGRVLRFNGKLFKDAGADHYSLPLTPAHIDLLIEAARANWQEVEPAIFGTLLERALDPTERHALGAHYTPRAYVERLVLPTVIQPLRAQWQDAHAAAMVLAREADALSGKAQQDKLAAARQQLRAFHHRLCTLRVLDPACGSANFLYVTLEHLKRLEGEVLNTLHELGQAQDTLGFEGETVTLQQLLGIELNPRAAALAELVLWIGWLQWHIRTRGNQDVAEPVVHNYGNIECRDAVLAWDAQQPALDAAGQPITRWDGRTTQPHPVTGQPVPDEAAQVPQWRYVGARQAEWPQADFIVGNPPFIGAASMRAALGDGYVEALRKAWPEVPESADFVMYWWQRAAAQVAAGQARRMGLITTNSLRQTFNRRVVQAALDAGTHLDMAIADHPWVDSASGAAVRIAMSVVAPGAGEGQLQTVLDETPGEFGEVQVKLAAQHGLIHADLSIGANVAAAQPLRAMQGISSPGVKLHGAGFIVTPEQATALLPPPLGEGRGGGQQRLIRHYRNGRDLMATPRNVLVIDVFGLSAQELRDQHPAIYQWLLERVKPERDQNNRATYRDNWWIFGEPRKDLRPALHGLPRYIATVETAKHRVFQFLDASILPDNMLVAIALDDAWTLGVLSSQLHIDWALATGGTLEDRPRYNKSRCFETFPFPDEGTGLTPELRTRIADLAEKIDAHRKRVLSPSFPLWGKAGMGADGAGMDARVGVDTPLAPTPTLPQGGRAQGAKVSPEAHLSFPPWGKAGMGADGAGMDARVGVDTPLAPTPTLPQGGREQQPAPAKDLPTLTGLYNVLAALREGRPLTPKEKTIHSQGLVSVLRELHDELDAAVLAAYGLPAQADTQAVLAHLVALNAQRVAEEAGGRVRWLRPDFQAPAHAGPAGQSAALALPAGAALPAAPAARAEQPWPASLPEQVRAVAQLLAASPVALPLSAIESAFKGRGPWKKGLPTLLATLEALGRAQAVTLPGDTPAWRGQDAP